MNGFKLVRSPEFDPDADPGASPQVTWGDILGTYAQDTVRTIYEFETTPRAYHDVLVCCVGTPLHLKEEDPDPEPQLPSHSSSKGFQVVLSPEDCRLHLHPTFVLVVTACLHTLLPLAGNINSHIVVLCLVANVAPSRRIRS